MENSPPPTYPRYRLARRILLAFACSAVLHRRRSFRRDALHLVKGMCPPPCIRGEAYIPSAAPCLLVANHYSRPGFSTWWLAIALSAVVPGEISWITVSEWRYEGRWQAFFMRPLTHLILHMAAEVYGFLRLPPNPPLPEEAAGRAAGVRSILKAAHASPPPILGLTPEGMDFAAGLLGTPPPGAGRMMLHLSQMGFNVVPVGIYEAEGCLHLHFGTPLVLLNAARLPPRQTDAAASRQVMEAILHLLPPSWRLAEE